MPVSKVKVVAVYSGAFTAEDAGTNAEDALHANILHFGFYFALLLVPQNCHGWPEGKGIFWGETPFSLKQGGL